MVGIAKYDLSLHIVTQFALVNGFDASKSADRHEYGCFDYAMVGRDESGAGIASLGGG